MPSARSAVPSATLPRATTSAAAVRAYAAVQRHVEANIPWGARVEVHLDDQGSGFAADANGPVYDQTRAAFTDT